VTIVRAFLVAQAVIAAAVAQLAPLLILPGQSCGRESFCDVSNAALVVVEIPTMSFAVLALVGAWWLSRDRLRGVVAFGVAAVAVGGSAWTLANIRLSLGSAQSVDSYQLWAAWPLVIWPAIVIVVTLLLALAPHGVSSRVIGIVWPVACALVSLFALTYLLPATDVRVAGLHWMGVVRVPQATAPIRDSNGRTISTDLVILVNAGSAYVVTLNPGDYTVVESCSPLLDSNGNSMQPRGANVSIHVDPGVLTVVPNRCPFG
jgi:hypothetical protein